jgi:hypothetical protein
MKSTADLVLVVWYLEEARASRMDEPYGREQGT